MSLVKYFKVRRFFLKSQFVEACAYNEDKDYINLVWAYYRLGMYESALNVLTEASDFKTLYAKTVCCSYLGRQKEILYYLNCIKEKYPEKLSLLIPLLATYSPKCALDLAKEINAGESLIYIALHSFLYSKNSTILKYESFLEKALINNPDAKLLYSNLKLNDDVDKLAILNQYLEFFELTPVALRNSKNTLNVRNLKSDFISSNINGPLVTIIVPAYNVENRIESSIESLTNQSYSNIEIIVVDDASTDNTANIIRQLELKYKNVQGLYLSENVGPFVAKNCAALNATGEFLTTHDADDWAHPERILNQVKPLLLNKKLIATTSQWIRLDDIGNFYAKQHFPFTRFNPSSPMFRRKEVVKTTGLWDCVRIAADTEFFERLKLIFGRQRILSIKLPLAIGAHRKNSLMNAKSTGNYSDQMSPIRIEYWEAWRFWHINQVRKGMLPVMPNLLDFEYQFSIPNFIKNSKESLNIVGKFSQASVK